MSPIQECNWPQCKGKPSPCFAWCRCRCHSRSELSGEQVEARLADALLRDRDVNLPLDDPLDVSIRDVVRALSGTVIEMIHSGA